jgi:glutathione S-transferase
MSELPILYSFRRCPYAMRARLALWVAGVTCELREVKLSDKPPEFIEASSKATVPVLILQDSKVVDESIDIMRWALAQNDPESWLDGDDHELIDRIDGEFKHHLDRYKYPTRYDDCDSEVHRAAGLEVLTDLNSRLTDQPYLGGVKRSLADMATFTFIRQFANTGREWFDAQPLPHLQRWLEGHLSSEIFAAIMPKYTPWQAGDVPVIFDSQTG